MGEQHEPHINTIINPDVCDMVFIWGSCCSPITNIWVYYGVYMGFMLLTHHRHLGSVWGLYGVHVAVCDG
jgi:hypothetical protein